MYESIKALEIRNLIMINLVFADNTVLSLSYTFYFLQ